MRNFFKSCKSSLRDRAELRQAGAQSVRVFLIPNKAPLVSGFLKGSRRTCIPPLCQWGRPLLRLCSFPHAIFTHFSAKSGIVNMCSWKEPEIHSYGFQLVSPTPLHPRNRSSPPKALVSFPSKCCDTGMGEPAPQLRVPCSNRSLEFSSW